MANRPCTTLPRTPYDPERSDVPRPLLTLGCHWSIGISHVLFHLDLLGRRRHRGASLGSTSGLGVYSPLSPGILWRVSKKCFKIPTKVVTEAFMRRREGNACMTSPILCIRSSLNIS